MIAVAIAGTALLLGTAGTMAQNYGSPYGNPYYGGYTGSPSQSAPVGLDSNPANEAGYGPRVTTGSGSHCHMVTRHMVRANGDRITVHRQICD
jgi:hypothetical protein